MHPLPHGQALGTFKSGTNDVLQETFAMGLNRTLQDTGIGIAICASALLAAPNASAYTECAVTPVSVFAGDEGAFYVVYSNGGSAVIVASDPDFKQTVALITTAIVADKQLDVRYSSDGVSCSATMQALIGVRLKT
jgi:hypothetical protein